MLTLGLTLSGWSQTKKIAHRSHAGISASFSAAGPDYLGMWIPPKEELKKVDFDTIAIDTTLFLIDSAKLTPKGQTNPRLQQVAPDTTQKPQTKVVIARAEAKALTPVPAEGAPGEVPDSTSTQLVKELKVAPPVKQNGLSSPYALLLAFGLTLFSLLVRRIF